MMPVGLYGDGLTAQTALVDGTTYFQYVGTAGDVITAGNILTRVTAQLGVAHTWGEIGIFTGDFVPNGNASLTRRGFVSVATIYNTLGVKNTPVNTGSIAEGDDLWVAFGSLAGVFRFQLRGFLADNIQSGAFQSVNGRLSELGSPVAVTLESDARIPAWIGLAI